MWEESMSKHFFITGILILVFLCINLVIVGYTKNQLVDRLTDTLEDYGWTGEGDIFNVDALYAYGLQFSTDWWTYYNDVIDIYNTLKIEVQIISLILGTSSVVFFIIGVFICQRRVKLNLMMLSDKTYWLFLLIALGIFLIIDWFCIMPIAWDIGVNLFTDAIFTIFTMIFLVWALDHREKLQWKSVKNRVLAKLGSLLSEISRATLSELWNIIEFRKSFPEIDWEKIDFRPVEAKRVLENADYFATLYKKYRDELSDIELRYSRYLHPKLANSLIDLQSVLQILERHFKYNKPDRLTAENLKEFTRLSLVEWHRMFEILFRTYKGERIEPFTSRFESYFTYADVDFYDARNL